MKFFTALIAAALLAACAAKSSDEEKVRTLVARAEQAAEARDTSDLLALIAPDYSDRQGFRRTELQAALTAYFLSHPSIELLVNIETLEFPVDGLARARIGVASVALDELRGDTVTLDLELRRSGDDWLITRADRIAR
jgi:hypothetical protein